ncbi:uncharacterized protein LOC134834967 [Culicoides brevitarsis]|uniref:uncharacterized protein LOC134834967 n=1 Tax=Culicoides brevitarsis TaxID=469753 RepID=UPI00307B5A36
MSILTIDTKTFVVTIDSEDEKLSICLTDFKETYKSVLSHEEAIQKANKLNLHMDSLEAAKVLSIISVPSEDAIFAPSESFELKFKYKISGVPYRFSWNLEKVDNNVILFPLLHAMLRQKHQIREFRKLPNSDPQMLDELPSYGDFDVRGLLSDHKNIEVLSKMCKEEVKVKESEQKKTSKEDSFKKSSLIQNKGAMKYQAMKRGLFAGKNVEESDSSQNDSQDAEEEKRKKMKLLEKSKEMKSEVPRNRLRNKLKI